MPGAMLAYHRDSNDSWLDELVGGIISPARRTPTRRDDRDEENSPFGTPDSLALNAMRVNPQSSLDWSVPYHLQSTQPESPTHSAGLQEYQSHLCYSEFSLRLTDDQANTAQPTTPAKQSQKWSFDDARSTISAASPRHLQPRSSSLDFTRKPPKGERENQCPPAFVTFQSEAAEPTVLKTGTALQKIPEETLPSYFSPTSSAGSTASSQPRRSTWSAFPRISMIASVVKSPPASDKTVLRLPRYGSENNVFNARDPVVKRPSPTFSDAKPIDFNPRQAVRLFSHQTEHVRDARPSGNQIRSSTLARLLVVIGICLSVFLVALDRNVVATAIPRITSTFHSYDDVGWYGSAYLMTAASFQPLSGRAYASFDIRWTFLVALRVFEIGSLFSAISPNSGLLIIGRAAQGAGSAGILTGAYTIGTAVTSHQRRSTLNTLLGVLFEIGAVTGPLLGGEFADSVTWRWAVNLPVGGLVFITVVLLFHPQTVVEKERLPWIKQILHLDPIGNVALISACAMLFLALELAKTPGSWVSPPCIGLLCGFGVASLCFAFRVIRCGDAALIPPRLYCQRTVAASCGYAFFTYGAILVHAYYLPVWFQAIRGDSALLSGVHMIPYMFTNALISTVANFFVAKNELLASLSILGGAIGITGASLLTLLNQESSTGAWIGFEVIAAAGLSMTAQQNFNAMQAMLPPEDVAMGTAAVIGYQSLGGAIFVSVGNTIFRNTLLDQNEEEKFRNIDIESALSAGITAFRSIASPQDVSALIDLYNKSLHGVFVSAAVLCCCAFLCSLGLEWKPSEDRQGLPKELAHRLRVRHLHTDDRMNK